MISGKRNTTSVFNTIQFGDDRQNTTPLVTMQYAMNNSYGNATGRPAGKPYTQRVESHEDFQFLNTSWNQRLCELENRCNGYGGCDATGKCKITKCEVGTYIDRSKETAACTKCPAGYATANEGSTNCTACEPGLFAKDVGLDRCISCAYWTEASALSGNSYQPGSNATACIRCPDGTQRRAGTDGKNVTDCVYVRNRPDWRRMRRRVAVYAVPRCKVSSAPDACTRPCRRRELSTCISLNLTCTGA
jgi:hypothetical protein